MATSHTNVLSLSDSRLRLVAAGLAAGILAAAIGGSLMTERAVAASHPEDPAEHTIRVTGTGRIIVSPDIADLRLGVSVTRPTVKAARAEAAQSMTRVLAALRKLGIAERDLQTTLLALQPNYDYSKNENPPRLNGYTLSNAVAVTIRDLDRIGDVIDGALAAGATTLDGVSFRTEDPAAAEQQAREQAMKQARAKAETLAAGGGVTIAGVASISETAAPTPYPFYAERMAAAQDTSTPIQVGTNEVIVSVTVAYLIR